MLEGIKYYVNVETGKLLDQFQMEKEWAVVYDGNNLIHSRSKDSLYEEVVKVECLEKV